MTGVVRDKPVFVVRRDINGGWGWALRSSNGMYLATSAYPYTRRRDCLRAIDTVLLAIFDASIEVEK